jgi:hypothetical protein
MILSKTSAASNTGGGCWSATTDFELGYGFVVQDEAGTRALKASLGCKNDVSVLASHAS